MANAINCDLGQAVGHSSGNSHGQARTLPKKRQIGILEELTRFSQREFTIYGSTDGPQRHSPTRVPRLNVRDIAVIITAMKFFVAGGFLVGCMVGGLRSSFAADILAHSPAGFASAGMLDEDATEWIPELSIDSPTSDAIDSDLAVIPVGHCDNRKEECWGWDLLPEGLLWHSYLAAPGEPRMSLVIFNDTNGGAFWDANLGGRMGLMRYGTSNPKDPHGWQWDLEGSVITRLDVNNAQDVESADYRFGTEMTYADGPWAMKFGYFHVSSHVGDEYIERNPTFQRINYVTESWIIGASYSPLKTVRLYGELANAFHVAGGAKKYQMQTGAEYVGIEKRPRWGAPFAAINLNFREAVDYDLQTTVQLGWAFEGSRTARRLRFGAQYFQGPTNQYEFFERVEEHIGGGFWFDF